MAIPYGAKSKSLKKVAPKAKKPAPKKPAPASAKGKPLFTPPGMKMDAEDKIDGGRDEKREKN